MKVTFHPFAMLLIAEVGGPEVCFGSDEGVIAFRCVEYDPFDERFACCKLALEPLEMVTGTQTHFDSAGNETHKTTHKDTVKVCGVCERRWCLKDGRWATLVRVDGIP